MANKRVRSKIIKNPWKLKSSRAVYDNPWISVREDKVLRPDGSPGIYGVIEFKNRAVGVLAIDENENVLLVGQYRYPLGRYSWEIPEGGCPKGEKLLTAAKRELEEETGCRARKWKKVFEMDLSNSVTDERATIFIARDLSEGTAHPEETEVLKLKRLPLTKAVQMVFRGQITDGISVAALLYASSWRPHKT